MQQLGDVRTAAVSAVLFTCPSCLQDVSYSSTYDVRAQGRHKAEGRKCTPDTQLSKLSRKHVSVSRTRYTTAPRCKDVWKSEYITEKLSSLLLNKIKVLSARKGNREILCQSETVSAIPGQHNSLLGGILGWTQWQSSFPHKWLLLGHFCKPLSSLKVNTKRILLFRWLKRNLWEFKDFFKRPQEKGTTNYVP